MKTKKIILTITGIAIGMALLCLLAAQAADITLAWEHPDTAQSLTQSNSSPNAASEFRFYYALGSNAFAVRRLTNLGAIFGTITNNLGQVRSNVFTTTFTNLQPDLYRFQATAANIWGLESLPSQTVVTPATNPPAPPSFSTIIIRVP